MRGLASCVGLWLLAGACSSNGVPSRKATDADVPTAKPDAATQVAMPTGTVRGRVDGLRTGDGPAGVVSAGGISRALGTTGYFMLEAVPAANEVGLFVRVPGYSLGQLQISVLDGRVRMALLEVVPFVNQVVPDPHAAQQLEFGNATQTHRVMLPADALAPVHGGALQGRPSLHAASLDARSAPGAMWVEDGSNRSRFRAFAMVELRASQPGAALTLLSAAQLRLRVADTAPSKLDVYRFDEDAGVWRTYAVADHDSSQHTVSVTVEQFGIYAAGQALAETGCVSFGLSDDQGQMLADAAIRFADTLAREGSELWTDGSGRACLPAAPDLPLRYTALAQSGTRVLGHNAELTTGSGPASCGASCADAGTRALVAQPVRCVRGEIASNGDNASITLWTSAAGSEEARAGQVYPGQHFCVDIGEESRLRFDSTLDCGEARELPSSAEAISCGQAGCAELGTIQCCADQETCGNVADDDCDQRVDEGCRCGSNDCSAERPATRGNADICCTETGLCGIRDRANKLDANHCFDAQTEARLDAKQCRDEVLDLGSGKQSVQGCCRADQRCGLRISPLSCVSREDAKYFTTASSPALSALACTY